MVSRFHITELLKAGTFTLDTSEFHHMVRVTRHKVGDTVRMFDGSGREADAEITFLSRSAATLNVGKVEAMPEENGPQFILAVPIPKLARAGWIVEKAVELGVSKLIPIGTTRSVVDPRETKLDNLRASVISAMKQSGRSRAMEITPVMKWSDFVSSVVAQHATVVAHPGGVPFTSAFICGALADAAKRSGLTKSKDGSPTFLAVAGPEGGFTVEEVTQAVTSGARLTSLGPRILRVETAALAMASIFLSSQLER